MRMNLEAQMDEMKTSHVELRTTKHWQTCWWLMNLNGWCETVAKSAKIHSETSANDWEKIHPMDLEISEARSPHPWLSRAEVWCWICCQPAVASLPHASGDGRLLDRLSHLLHHAFASSAEFHFARFLSTYVECRNCTTQQSKLLYWVWPTLSKMYLQQTKTKKVEKNYLAVGISTDKEILDWCDHFRKRNWLVGKRKIEAKWEGKKE